MTTYYHSFRSILNVNVMPNFKTANFVWLFCVMLESCLETWALWVGIKLNQMWCLTQRTIIFMSECFTKCKQNNTKLSSRVCGDRQQKRYLWFQVLISSDLSDFICSDFSEEKRLCKNVNTKLPSWLTRVDWVFLLEQ